MNDAIPADDAADARVDRWTVKNVPLRTRLLAMSCARRAGKPAGQWLAAAVDLAAERQGHGTVMPPPPAPAAAPVVAIGALERLAALAVLVTPAGRDSAAMRAVRSLIHAEARAMRADQGRTTITSRADRAPPKA